LPEFQPSAEEAQARELAEARRATVWQELFGVEPPMWENDREAPPLDEDLLRRYARRELTGEEGRRIFALSLKYWSWARASVRICAEEFRRLQEERPIDGQT
jgi:hypothetical protein